MLEHELLIKSLSARVLGSTYKWDILFRCFKEKHTVLLGILSRSHDIFFINIVDYVRSDSV